MSRQNLTYEDILGGDKTLEFQSKIGEGGFGAVFRVRNKETNEVHARKVIRPDSVPFPDVHEQLLTVPKEARNVDDLYLNREGENHENLVNVLKHGYLPTASFYYIDMELCDFDMHQYISGGDSYTVSDDGTPNRLQGKRGPYDIVRISIQLANGIEFIHQHGKTHRDLKPKNILYSMAQNKWKIADFGLTSEGSSEHSIVTKMGGGTIGYYAPEIALCEEQEIRFTNRADIWALGCIIYELATGTKAFPSNESLRAFSYSKIDFPQERFPFDGVEADFLFKLIQSMLVVDPNKRLSASGVLRFLGRFHANDTLVSIKHRYSLGDRFWLTIVAKELHHVRGLCNRNSGNETHEVRELSSNKNFARKLTRPFGTLNADAIKLQRTLFSELLPVSEEAENSCAYIVNVLRSGVLHARTPVDTKYYFLDMELCSIDLQKFLHTTNFKGEGNIWKIMLQIASGVEFVHKKGIVVRDLKPSRVLYSERHLEGVWKLGDFSLVATRPPSPNEELVDPSPSGTPGYSAPELINHVHFDEKVDIWAMGCILHELLIGKPLFGSNWDVAAYAEKANLGTESDILQPFKNQLLSRLNSIPIWSERMVVEAALPGMLRVAPTGRPSAGDLIKHAFKMLLDAQAPSQRGLGG